MTDPQTSGPNGASSQRPLLLLDVDGVLNVLGPPPAEGVLAADGLPVFVQIPRRTPQRLRQLAEHFDLVWATMWERHADQELGPVLGLPPLPVITFDFSEGYPGADLKLPSIRRFVRSRACAWIDDAIGLDAHAWAGDRSVPTLFLDIEPHLGLTDGHVKHLLEFARRAN